jgi:diacylglycerol kinase (ATP)
MQVAKETYTHISIIYNPVSTSGNAEVRAKRLHSRLARRGLSNINLVPTEYAGHAEKIAYDAALRHKHTLLVSVSGDGGYNEVINGALAAQDKKPAHKPVCAILAAGNANDHRRTIRKRPLTFAILRTTPEPIDILSLTITTSNSQTVRYAHSYIGLGVSSEVANKINSGSYKWWQELMIALRSLLNFPYFKIIDSHGVARRLDFLLFANIHQMAKYMKLRPKVNLTSGLFQVVAIPHTNRLHRLAMTVRFITVGFKHALQESAYEFQVAKTEPVQLDGEVTLIPGGARVKVESARGKLLTLR